MKEEKGEVALYSGPVPDPDEEFYVAREAALRLGVSRSRITQMVDEGKLDAYKIKHHLFIPKKQIDECCRRRDLVYASTVLGQQST